MKNIVKSLAIVGQVISVIMGENFTSPTTRALEQNHTIGLF